MALLAAKMMKRKIAWGLVENSLHEVTMRYSPSLHTACVTRISKFLCSDRSTDVPGRSCGPPFVRSQNIIVTVTNQVECQVPSSQIVQRW